MLVVDASIILSLVLDDESSLIGQAVVEATKTVATFAPDLLWYEVRNAMVSNERRGRHTPEQTAEFLWDVSRLSITLRHPPVEHDMFDLARQHGLSIYDAAYLDMAIRYDAKLATLDKKLWKAANKEGVDCWDEVINRLEAGS